MAKGASKHSVAADHCSDEAPAICRGKDKASSTSPAASASQPHGGDSNTGATVIASTNSSNVKKTPPPFSAAASSASDKPPLFSALLLTLQMFFCVAGIYVCFGWWSVKQERVVTKPYFRRLSDGSIDPSDTTGTILPTVYGVALSQYVAGLAVGLLLLTGGQLWTAMSTSVPSRHGTQKVHRHGNGKAFASDSASGSAVTNSRKGGAPVSSANDSAIPWTSRDVSQAAAVGFTNAFGTSLGFAAMRRLSYPVVLVTKMSKMLPVIVVGMVWHGTRYSRRKLLACLLITSGILAFYWQEEMTKKSGSGDASDGGRGKGGTSSGKVGLILLFINLVVDGFTNSTQDVLVKRRRWGGNQLMVWTNLASAAWVVLAVALLEWAEPVLHHSLNTVYSAIADAGAVAVVEDWAGEAIPFHDFSRTLSFLHAYPEAEHDMISLSLFNAFGQFFIFRTISLFGSLTLTAMTLVRKAGSVVLSIVIHGHRVSRGQWAALATVLAGVIWEGYTNITEKQASKASSARLSRPTSSRGGGVVVGGEAGESQKAVVKGDGKGQKEQKPGSASEKGKKAA